MTTAQHNASLRAKVRHRDNVIRKLRSDIVTLNRIISVKTLERRLALGAGFGSNSVVHQPYVYLTPEAA
jgi:hypothetical protein